MAAISLEEIPHEREYLEKHSEILLFYAGDFEFKSNGILSENDKRLSVFTEVQITTSNLNRWPMPRIAKDDAVTIAGYVDTLISKTEDNLERKIDSIVYNAFNLREEEISKIESFVG